MNKTDPVDDYFAREDVEKLRRLAHKQKQETQAQDREALRKLHHMKCPKCGLDLHTLRRVDVEIDACFTCKGIWLDEGELERLQKDVPTRAPVIQAVLNLFK
ncbi:MAG: zf-TFIIB domain-containing protein [Myxococcaceae bacterium]